LLPRANQQVAQNTIKDAKVSDNVCFTAFFLFSQMWRCNKLIPCDRKIFANENLLGCENRE